MGMAALLVIANGLTLSLAPAVRYHGGSEYYQFDHWIGILVWVIISALLHRQSIRKSPQRDPYILPIAMMLSGIGLLTIWRLYPAFGLRQTIWLGIAGACVWLGLQFPQILGLFRRYKYIWLILGLLLTALTFIIGINPSGNGPSLWLQLFGVHFQPSEPLKLLLILYLAGFFTETFSTQQRTWKAILPTLVVMALALLLLISQRDLGTASIFIVIYLAMLLTIDRRRFLLWFTPIILTLSIVLSYLFVDIVRLRMDTWLHPFSDPTGSSYQVVQSMIAIAEGGLIGSGLGLGSPGLVPVSLSDFIFTAIVEEAGFVGATTLILLFMFLIYRAIKAAQVAENTFYKYLAMGVAFYFGFQSILIIGGNIGLLPLTGVTLPLVSYGGSSLVISFIAVLILLVITNHAPPVEARQTVNLPRLTIVSALLMSVMILEIIVTSLFSFWFRTPLISRTENARWYIQDRFVPRGSILDRQNQLIASSSGPTGEIERIIHYEPLTPVIGYTSAIYNQTGLEASLFPYLRGQEGISAWDVLRQDLLYNQPLPGLNVRLTLDLNMQQVADDLLGESAGAIVVMDAESGEILTMASHPQFDADQIDEDWNALISDEAAPLLNRATQGRYPAGNALLPFILVTQMESRFPLPAPHQILPDNNNRLSCPALRDQDVSWATLAVSDCPLVQKALAEEVGVAALKDVLTGFGFDTPPSLRLSVANADQEDIEDDEAFYLGQSGVDVSPLQMALSASAITNNGMMPAPRIVNGYQDPSAVWRTLPKLGDPRQALPPQQASDLQAQLSMADLPYWRVSATALESDQQEWISWFVAGTTDQWPGRPLVVVVALEKKDRDGAAEIGATLFKQILYLEE